MMTCKCANEHNSDSYEVLLLYNRRPLCKVTTALQTSLDFGKTRSIGREMLPFD